MKQFLACLGREAKAAFRGATGFVLPGVFLVFGISNPVLTELTPLIMESLADSFADMGMDVPVLSVDALASWGQFFKNLFLMPVVFHILQARIFTREYSAGTLIIPLTRGLSRPAMVLSKTVWLILLWTACYALAAGSTFLVNEILWGNGMVEFLPQSVLGWYVFGLWTISLSVLFSVIFCNSAMVMLGTGGTVFVCYLVGLLPKVGAYLPTALMDTSATLSGAAEPMAGVTAYVVTAILSSVAVAVSVWVFDRKEI